MLVFVSYDISDDRTRSDIRNFVRNNGFVRLHKSVYVGDVSFENFIFLLKYFKKFKRDKENVEIEVFKLCKKCEFKFRRLKNKFIKEFDLEVVFIQKNSV